MSTPAAKRRRVDAANAVLRKPFHSPVIRRPNAAEDSPGDSTTPDPTKAAGDAYSPSSRRPPQILRPVRSLGALRQTPNRPSSSLRFKTPLPPRAGSSTVRREGSKTRVEAGDDEADGEAGSVFFALVRAHRHTAQDAILKDLGRKLETVRQAKRIEEGSDRSRPGAPIDQELRELIVKWKGASRLAAEELFESVKERVDSAGGPKVWREMRKRQMQFYQAWDQESPSTRKRCNEGDREEEIEGDYEDEDATRMSQAVVEGEDHAEEEDCEPVSAEDLSCCLTVTSQHY